MLWHTRLVRLGRARTMLLLTTFCVIASVCMTTLFYVVFEGSPEDLLAYFVPAVIIPALVAPIPIHLLLSLALALDAAHTQATQQQAQLQNVRQLDLVGRLASGLAHDFNNLLTVVRANVDALGGSTANEELAAIDNAAVRGARLTRRLLAVSRHEDIERTTQPIAPLLHETADTLRRILPAGVHFEMPAEVPEATLDFDHDAIQQALLNLAINARDAMGARGRLSLTVQTRRESDGSWIVIRLQDDGPGMSADVLSRATEPFFSTKAAHEGTGLGLALVHRTMALHGGRLELESEVGVGTSAILWLPLPTVATEATRRHPLSTTPPRGVSRGSSYDLLVVDDDAEIRRVTERALGRLGHRVATAADVASAMHWLSGAAKVDAIISDVMMPGGTGIDLVRLLRSADNHTPVLLVSGFSLESLDDAVSQYSSVAFLAKPWALDTLMAGIEHVIHPS